MLNLIEDNKHINDVTSICLGKFDGIHRGHQRLIESCVNEKTNGMLPTVITFNDNPKLYLSKEKPPQKLMTSSVRNSIFEDMGIEYLYEPDFTDIMNLSAEEFAKNILREKLNCKKFFCGQDFRLGKNALTDVNNFREICKRYDIDLEVISPVKIEGEVISSERIRDYLTTGNLDTAIEYLGHPFCYDFIVEHGNKLGRKIGIPTINQIFPSRYLLPKRGVYASFVEFQDRRYYSVTNIGIRPTIGGTKPLSETWIPQYSAGLLYGSSVKVGLLKYLREEKKFSNLDSLKEAIKLDADNAKDIYNTILINN